METPRCILVCATDVPVCLRAGVCARCDPVNRPGDRVDHPFAACRQESADIVEALLNMNADAQATNLEVSLRPRPRARTPTNRPTPHQHPQPPPPHTKSERPRSAKAYKRTAAMSPPRSAPPTAATASLFGCGWLINAARFGNALPNRAHQGAAPLHLAVTNHSGPAAAVIRLLLSHGALVNGRSDDGLTALHFAAIGLAPSVCSCCPPSPRPTLSQ